MARTVLVGGAGHLADASAVGDGAEAFDAAWADAAAEDAMAAGAAGGSAQACGRKGSPRPVQARFHPVIRVAPRGRHGHAATVASDPGKALVGTIAAPCALERRSRGNGGPVHPGGHSASAIVVRMASGNRAAPGEAAGEQ